MKRIGVFVILLISLALPVHGQSQTDEIFSCGPNVPVIANAVTEAGAVLTGASPLMANKVIPFLIENLQRIYTGCIDRGIRASDYSTDGVLLTFWQDKYLVEAVSSQGLEIRLEPFGSSECSSTIDIALDITDGQERNWSMIQIPASCFFKTYVVTGAADWQLYFHRLPLYLAKAE